MSFPFPSWPVCLHYSLIFASFKKKKSVQGLCQMIHYGLISGFFDQERHGRPCHVCSYCCGQCWWEVTDFLSAPDSGQCCLHCNLDINLLDKRFCFVFKSYYSFRGGSKVILVKPIDVICSSTTSWTWCVQGNELTSIQNTVFCCNFNYSCHSWASLWWSVQFQSYQHKQCWEHCGKKIAMLSKGDTGFKTD